MDYNNYGNYGIMPKKKKDNGALGIVLIILLVIAVGATGYITYKTLTEDDKPEEKVEVKKEEKNLLSDTDTLKVGNELYKKGYEMMFNRGALALEDCKKAYDEADKYFVKGAKINYTSSYYRSETDIKYGKVENNFYDENGSLSCRAHSNKYRLYISEQDLKISSKKEKVIVFDKVVTYCDKNTYEHMEKKDLKNCPKTVTTTYKFTIEKEQDTWKISKLSIIN